MTKQLTITGKNGFSKQVDFNEDGSFQLPYVSGGKYTLNFATSKAYAFISVSFEFIPGQAVVFSDRKVALIKRTFNQYVKGEGIIQLIGGELRISM